MIHLNTPLVISVGGKNFLALRTVLNARSRGGYLVELTAHGYTIYSDIASAHVSQIYSLHIDTDDYVYHTDPLCDVDIVLDMSEILDTYCLDADVHSASLMKEVLYKVYEGKGPVLTSKYEYVMPSFNFQKAYQYSFTWSPDNSVSVSDGEKAAVEMAKLIPDIRNPDKEVVCPAKPCYEYLQRGIPRETTMFNMVMHLNDREGWSRESIADWVEVAAVEHGIDITFPTPENPPPEPGEEKMKESMKEDPA